MNILDADGNVLHTWTLSDPSDVIGVTVGGNRYGWMLPHNMPFVAIDNSVSTSRSARRPTRASARRGAGSSSTPLPSRTRATA